MTRSFYAFLTVIILSSYCSTVNAQSNDHIFPASAAAKHYIDFDSKGFLVNGKRTFIVSAGLEYARIPHQLWYDRLLRIKRAGFNCIEIYTMWNFHEPQEGKFDFTGDHDLGAFLKVVKDLGLYAIVRVGPYYCAEWDLGGYPIWLKFKKGVSVREDNKPFEQYVDRFFDHLLPIVFKNQINKGGAVILVQLENEHPKSWGNIVYDGYFKNLQTKALDLGLQVPYFFSGLHHGSDPVGDDNKLDDDKRPNPWMSTEFWSVWYSQYGAKPGDDELYDRRTWKIISRGGNGYNYYMAHGGSNFGYTNNDEDAASYDYGSAIGQTGDLRPIYYTFKRAAWFARSFENVLENSSDASSAYPHIATDSALKVTARTSPAGDIIYLDNPGKKDVSTALNISGAETLTADKKLTIKPGEIYPLVHNFKINDDVTLNWALTRVFAVVKQENTTSIIVDAEEKSPVLLQFGLKNGASSTSPEVKINSGTATINENMPSAAEPVAYTFTSGSQTIRVLAMNRQQTDKTWITEIANKNYIINGLAYIGDATIKDQQLHLITETPLNQNGQQVAVLYTANAVIPFNTGAVPGKAVNNIPLNNWEYKSGSLSAATTVNTTGWLKSKDPQPMGADGDITADAWYRTAINALSDGKYTLQIKGNGRGQAFVDGKPAATWNLNKNEVSFNLKKGKHTLAIFTAHDGRDKLVSYIGPIDKIDNKGVSGNAVIKKGGPFITGLKDWYFAKVAQKSDVKAGPITDASAYKKYKIGDDAFNRKEGYGWFKTTIPQQPAGTTKITLFFKSVDENATVFVNGKEMIHHEGWDQPFEVTINDAEALKKSLDLSVFIENHSNEGGIDQPVKINAIGNATAVTGWEMKGGPGDALGVKGWTKLAQTKETGGPIFYRTTFSVPQVKDRTLIWRFDPEGLGHGSVWVNGHNLGRYPEKLDMKSLYIPECWLNAGMNQLVVYDEDGKPINKTQVVTESGANRSINAVTAKLN